MERSTFQGLALPAKIIAGMLQGSSSVSAPVSITFLIAMKLERTHFIATIFIFFFSMGMVQFIWLSIMVRFSSHMWGYSLLAVIPLVGAMPIGTQLIQHISKETLDRIILILSFVLVTKLVMDIFRRWSWMLSTT